MRKLLITLLMASAAATPALAGPRHDSDRQQTREERQQAREDSRSERVAPARAERAAPVERTQRADRPQVQVRAQSPQYQPRAERPQQTYAAPARVERNLDAARAENARREAATAARDERVQSRSQTVQQLRDDRVQLRDQRVEAREQRQAARPDRVVSRARPPVISDVPRPGTQPPPPVAQAQSTAPANWRVTWRDNDRYDWQNHRRHHRSLFHLGFYYDPYGWGYQPYSIGWRLWPSYYSRNYWITDPWMYRLPYAPAGYVWIRYWNDALLVDTWSGQVVDMIPNFFC
jgi:Ni/Co efflux regulator RcnB